MELLIELVENDEKDFNKPTDTTSNENLFGIQNDILRTKVVETHLKHNKKWINANLDRFVSYLVPIFNNLTPIYDQVKHTIVLEYAERS